MEIALNAVGVPAARVRSLAEFLGEAPGKATLPVFEFASGVRTPGLGFAYAQDGGAAAGDAPELGVDNAELLGRI